jgi:crotonobetainyl-CoA:carnitine CoA-transferase CaiB-like acyl-CoA transferase
MSRPLAGIRILTLAHLYPGPFATMMLADLGADVIIVEGPTNPDRTRRFPGHFEALNRNKRAVSIDLKDTVGRADFLQLVETADVILEGFRPGVMARLGLSPEQLRERNPKLICVSLSGFGQTGPMAPHGAHDLSLQGVAGMLDIPVGSEATDGIPPFVMADLAAANAAALAISTALLQRERTGHAAMVDVSMLDSVVSWMTPSLVPTWNDQKPARLPPTDPGYGVFATRDGRQLTLSISGEDHLWRSLCEIVGMPQHASLLEEERILQRSRVQQDLRAAIVRHDAAWLETAFDEHKLPFGPVRSRVEVADDPQIKARKLVAEFRKEDGTTMRYVRQPLVFDGEFTTVHCGAPALGQHNPELLRKEPNAAT